MTLGKYIKDKLILFFLNGIGVFLLSLYLFAVGNNTVTIILICTVWGCVFFISAVIDYKKRKRYFKRIKDLMVELDQPYLIHEFMESSYRLDDQLYREIMQRSNKAVIERIYELESEQKEYREFIEGWIHEVKLPITGIRLLCQDIEQESCKRIEVYLSELDNDVEQTLFYARSDQIYKDYMIRETELKPIIFNVLVKNKHLLIQNQMNAQVELENITVFSDGKWLEFILGQILFNAVKYKKDGCGNISFNAKTIKNGIILTVRDDGIGISEEEKDRIFEKGFTGSNGRNTAKSTGIGLYLCKKLCFKLGLEISAESMVGEFTEIALVFPKHPFLSEL